MARARFFMTAFSICLHASVAGALLLFSGGDGLPEEKVYHVSLAEFSAPAAAEPTGGDPALPPSESTPPPPAPEPEPVKEPEPVVEPEVKPEPVKEPEAKVISPKKTTEPPKRAQAKPKPATPRPAQTAQVPSPNAQPGGTGPAGPQPSQVGGLAAYRSDVLDQKPSISRRAAPDYPSKARRMNIEGKVTVQLVVDTSGTPKECSVKSAHPPGYFEDAALDAAQRMRFIPGKLRGQPVNTVVLLPFAFKLR